MGKVLVNIGGEQVLLERKGPYKIGLYATEDSEEPYSTVAIPQEYAGFVKIHRPGRGNNRAYKHQVSWLVEHVPEIQQGVKEAVNQRDIRSSIGV